MTLLVLLVTAAVADPGAPPAPEAKTPAEAWSDFPGLPIFSSMNPLEYSRSPLFSPPILRPQKDWAFSLQLDYASAIELYGNDPNSVLLDAELGHLTFTATFRLSPSLFFLVQGGVQGAYRGFLDSFLNWYHSLLNITYEARDLRPKNVFGYYFQSGSARETYKPVDLTLLDTRLGLGWMIADDLQLLVTLVVPTAWVDGYAAHTIQLGAILTWQRPLWSWLLFQGTLGLGATPRTGGLLGPYQNLVFLSASVGGRARLSQSNFLYLNFYFGTPIYAGTGDRPLDVVEGSLDFGWMYRNDAGWEFSAGMTEDPVAAGPALDIIFRFGVRHGF
ncbi:MAG TPA: DUF3187 family protein [Myxococcaceae bacterium]|nr:DUF3187 family protein [Myxococcaceae bacterium]